MSRCDHDRLVELALKGSKMPSHFILGCPVLMKWWYETKFKTPFFSPPLSRLMESCLGIRTCSAMLHSPKYDFGEVRVKGNDVEGKWEQPVAYFCTSEMRPASDRSKSFLRVSPMFVEFWSKQDYPQSLIRTWLAGKRMRTFTKFTQLLINKCGCIDVWRVGEAIHRNFARGKKRDLSNFVEGRGDDCA